MGWEYIYIAVDALGITPSMEYMKRLKDEVCASDTVKPESVLFLCINNSLELVNAVQTNMDMHVPDNWRRLKIIMLPKLGSIMGIYPRHAIVELANKASSDLISYDLFAEWLNC